MTDPMLDMWLESIGDKRHYYFVNEVLGSIGRELVCALLQAGHRAALSPYSGVFAKDAAALAGLGTIGENNLLVTEEYGPRVRLRIVVTDAELRQLLGSDGGAVPAVPAPAHTLAPR